MYRYSLGKSAVDQLIGLSNWNRKWSGTTISTAYKGNFLEVKRGLILAKTCSPIMALWLLI
jgi:hypothetical protein